MGYLTFARPWLPSLLPVRLLVSYYQQVSFHARRNEGTCTNAFIALIPVFKYDDNLFPHALRNFPM